MQKYDVVILTDSRYVTPPIITPYIQNLLNEDLMVSQALKNNGLRVHRIAWDHPDFDWSTTRSVLFRSTWDYFDRYNEFSIWLDKVNQLTHLINSYELILWNLNKYYLLDLQNHGINIPPTIFVETGDQRSLRNIINQSGWEQIILKPAISGAARHTYKFNKVDADQYESIFQKLITNESMLVQEFQFNVIPNGEVALMVYGGKFSHAILKKAKPGDFRVQDDFGGSVHEYKANANEIAFAEKIVGAIDPLPVYARVDVIKDNHGNLCLIELELIEPELWFRNYSRAANLFAIAFLNYFSRLK